MKWSEQMRVLQSEDEHYNQLMLNVTTGELFINSELITILHSLEEKGFITEVFPNHYVRDI